MDHSKLTSEEMAGLLNGAGSSAIPLTEQETEALRELLAVTIRSTAPVVSAALEEPVVITAPKLQTVTKELLFTGMEAPLWIALGEFSGSMDGAHFTVIEQAAAQALLAREDRQREAWEGLVREMFEGMARSISAVLEQKIEYALTGMDTAKTAEGFTNSSFVENGSYVRAAFELKTGDKLASPLSFFMPLAMAKGLAGFLTEDTDAADEPKQAEAEEVQAMDSDKQEQEKQQQPAGNPEAQQNESRNVQPVQFAGFGETEAHKSEPGNLDMLMDIPLQVTVELGRTKRMVKEILGVSQGSIIELDKLAGEPVDILVNDKLIAVGEVVVIDENFGVRVTDILSAAERITKLR